MDNTESYLILNELFEEFNMINDDYSNNYYALLHQMKDFLYKNNGIWIWVEFDPKNDRKFFVFAHKVNTNKNQGTKLNINNNEFNDPYEALTEGIIEVCYKIKENKY